MALVYLGRQCHLLFYNAYRSGLGVGLFFIQHLIYANKKIRMPKDEVRFCAGNMCVAARGENARLLMLTLAIVLLVAAVNRLPE